MTDSFKIALAQLDLLVGDVQGNATRVVTTARRARAELGADLILFPELTLTADDRIVVQMGMLADSDLSADNALSPKPGTAGDSRLRGDHRVLADLNVVRDLNKIVEFCTTADDGRLQ